jgi:hypothetical protein
MAVSGQLHTPSSLPSGKILGSNWRRQWGAPEIVWTILEKKNLLPLTGFDPQSVEPATGDYAHFRFEALFFLRWMQHDLKNMMALRTRTWQPLEHWHHTTPHHTTPHHTPHHTTPHHTTPRQFSTFYRNSSMETDGYLKFGNRNTKKEGK